MNYSTMTERETEIELSTNVSEGLTSFTAHDRLIDNGRNAPEKTYAKSIMRVILSQFTDLYTVAFVAMGVITALLDFKGSFGAWIAFFAVAVINMVSGFLRDNEDRKIALSFDKKREDLVKVIRDGRMMMQDPTLLVKGDIVVLEQGDFVPADIRILECENLKADESIFKNRLVPVDKKSDRIEETVDFSACSNMLYTGSSIAQGSAKGAIVATGKDTVLAKYIEKKSKKLNMHDKFARNAKSEKILTIVAIIVAMIVLVQVSVSKRNVNLAILSSFAVALCLLPAPVSIVRTVAVKLKGMLLERQGVCFTAKDFVYDVGMTDFLLFDKGGMLTGSELTLEETFVPNDESIEMAVLCSDCDINGGMLTGNEMDVATFKWAQQNKIDVKKLLNDYEKLMFMPFDETRKLMACLVKKNEGYRLIVKGSVEVIPTFCGFVLGKEELKEMSGEVMHELENASSSLAEKGLKIRAVAYRDIDAIPENIEDEIKNLVFAGVLGYREVITRNSRETIKKLEKAFVKPRMVTGDQTITAAVLARQAGLIRSEKECISFREISDYTDEELLMAIEKYKVFTSASGEDRERLVRVISQKGFVCAVAGEQMTEPSVALYANVVFGDNGKNDCDVCLDNQSINTVGDVVNEARAMRSNMTNISSMAISVGIAEAMTFLYMLFTNQAFTITPVMSLMMNLFIVFVPCVVAVLCAKTCADKQNKALVAAKCGLSGVICCLFALGVQNNVFTFFALYAVCEAIRLCLSFGNIRNKKACIISCVAFALMIVMVSVAAEMGLWGVFSNENIYFVFMMAIVCSGVNALIPYIKLKGRKA